MQATALRSLAVSALVFAIAIAFAGCGGSSSSGCDGACDRASSDCSNFPVTSDCASLCESSLDQAKKNGCEAQDEALIACINDASDKTVCSGHFVPKSCEDEDTKWQNCLTEASKGSS